MKFFSLKQVVELIKLELAASHTF